MFCSARKYGRILRHASVGMALVGRGRVLLSNPAFDALLGSAGASRGHRMLEALAPHGGHDLSAQLSALSEPGMRASWPVRTPGESGEVVWQVDAVVIGSFRRQPLLLLEARDVTAERSAEERMNAAREAAERANRTKSAFLANMSHEIRTPIQTINLSTELLFDTPLDEEQREYTSQIRFAADVLLYLINDILDFSKIEAGKLDLEILDFDLRTTIEEVSDILAVKPQEKGLEYICFLDPQVPSRLRGDEGRLRQVLNNLVGNAIKFTNQGEVALHVTLEHETEDTATLRFTVRDTGIGIADDRLSRLFSAFTQADSSTTRRYGGSGLGLAISKHLVELHGGELKVESAPGHGSTFTVCLPVAGEMGSGEEA